MTVGAVRGVSGLELHCSNSRNLAGRRSSAILVLAHCTM
jgi:hypothetical protein